MGSCQKNFEKHDRKSLDCPGEIVGGNKAVKHHSGVTQKKWGRWQRKHLSSYSTYVFSWTEWDRSMDIKGISGCGEEAQL